MWHRRFVYQIAGDIPVEIQLLCSFLQVCLNCMINNNKVLLLPMNRTIIHLIAQHIVYDTPTITFGR